MSVFSDDKTDAFAASLLISYCSFLSSIWSSIVMIYFIFILKDIFLIKRFCLNIKGLSDGKAVSFTKKEHGSTVHF